MDVAQASAKVILALRKSGHKKAVVFLTPRLVVSACHRHKVRLNARRVEYVLKVGEPNYKEREFLRQCKKAGEPLPVKRVQFSPWPVPRA